MRYFVNLRFNHHSETWDGMPDSESKHTTTTAHTLKGLPELDQENATILAKVMNEQIATSELVPNGKSANGLGSWDFSLDILDSDGKNVATEDFSQLVMNAFNEIFLKK